jgi:hypothetical protein
MVRKSLACAAALAAAIITVAGFVARAHDATPNGGNGILYIGGYPNQIYVIDEATEKISATIPVQVGIPRTARAIADLKRLYVLSAEQEIWRFSMPPRTRRSIVSWNCGIGGRMVRRT